MNEKPGRDGRLLKIVLDGKRPITEEVRVARSAGYSRRQLLELGEVVGERREEIERAWNEHFG